MKKRSTALRFLWFAIVAFLASSCGTPSESPAASSEQLGARTAGSPTDIEAAEVEERSSQLPSADDSDLPLSIALAGADFEQLGSDIDTDPNGTSVSTSADGSRIAIGYPHLIPSEGAPERAGLVRIFEWDSTEWRQLGSDIVGEAVGDASGFSVSLSGDGDRVAIGAPENNQAGRSAGRVRVLEWDNSDWTQLGEGLDGTAAGEWLGQWVALSDSGSRIAVGSSNFDPTGNADSPRVRVFDWDGFGWVRAGEGIAGHGGSLSRDGSRLVVGSTGSSGGPARVLEWDGNSWEQLGSDIEVEIEGEVFFGFRFSLSADGRRLAIGHPSQDGSTRLAGEVRILDWDGSDWVQVGPTINGSEAGGQLGWGVSLSDNGSRVAVAAIRSDGVAGGHTWVFDLVDQQWLEVGSDIDVASSGDVGGGIAVALSGDGGVLVAATSAFENGFLTGQTRAFLVPSTAG